MKVNTVRSKKELVYDIKQDGINEVIDENGNMIMMLREVAWQGKQHKLELRKWLLDTDGETPMRGVTFMSEKGPHNLTETMVRLGYGETTKLLKELSNREDFDDSLVRTIGQEKVDKTKKQTYTIDEEDYFIPNKENLGI